MLLNKENEENISRDSFFDQIFENIPSIHYDNIMKYKERMDNQDTLNAEEKEIFK